MNTNALKRLSVALDKALNYGNWQVAKNISKALAEFAEAKDSERTIDTQVAEAEQALDDLDIQFGERTNE